AAPLNVRFPTAFSLALPARHQILHSRRQALHPTFRRKMPIRNLVLVFGDQLDASSSAFEDFDVARDAVAMQEVREEATYIRQHKIRLVLFFSAMRHFRDD